LSIFFDNYEKKKNDINSGVKSLKVVEFNGIDFVGKTQFIKETIRLFKEKEKKEAFYSLYDVKWNGKSADVIDVLLTMRADLGRRYRFKFPIFDFAIEKLNKTKYDHANNNLHDNSMNLIRVMESVCGVGASITVADAAYNLGAATWKYYCEKRDKYFKLISVQSPDEIRKIIQTYFALDINENMRKKNVPIVFFIDSFEILNGGKPNSFFSNIGWLLNTPSDLGFEDNRGIIFDTPKALWIISSNESILWPEHWGDSQICKYKLTDFNFKETKRFLSNCGICEVNIQNYLFKLTSGTPGYLNICVEKYRDLKREGKSLNEGDFGSDIRKLMSGYFKSMSDKKIEILFFLALLGVWNDDTLKAINPFGYFEKSNQDYLELLNTSLINEHEKIFFFHQTPQQAVIKLLSDETKYRDVKEKITDYIIKECEKSVNKKDFNKRDLYMITEWTSRILMGQGLLPEGQFEYYYLNLAKKVIEKNLLFGRVGSALMLSESLFSHAKKNYSMNTQKIIGEVYSELLPFSSAIQSIHNKNIFLKNLVMEMDEEDSSIGYVKELMKENEKNFVSNDSQMIIEEAEDINRTCVENYGADSLEVASSLQYLCSCYMLTGDYATSLNCIKDAIEIHTKLFGTHAEVILQDYRLLSDVYAYSENYEELKNSIEMERKVEMLLSRGKTTSESQLLYYSRLAFANMMLELEWKNEFQTAKEIFFRLPDNAIIILILSDLINVTQAVLIEDSKGDESKLREEIGVMVDVSEKTMRCVETLNGGGLSKFAVGFLLLKLYYSLEKYDKAINLGIMLLDEVSQIERFTKIKTTLQAELGKNYFMIGNYNEAQVNLECAYESYSENDFIGDGNDLIEVAIFLLKLYTTNFDERSETLITEMLRILVNYRCFSYEMGKIIEEAAVHMINRNMFDEAIFFLNSFTDMALLKRNFGGYCEWVELLVSFVDLLDVDENRLIEVILNEINQAFDEILKRSFDFDEKLGEYDLKYDYNENLIIDIENTVNELDKLNSPKERIDMIKDQMNMIDEKYGKH